MFTLLRNVSLWTSAILLALIPIALAVDFGGIYHWSQYVAAIGIFLALLLALPGLTDSTASSGLRQHALLMPLGALLLWAWFQSSALPAGVVAWISPGSHAAYTHWLDGYGGGSRAGDSSSFSISVSPYDTAHVATVIALLMPLCWTASVVFHARSRLKMLLSAIAIAGASVAILGLYRKLDPIADLWIFQAKPNAFGGFVNRNNAALMLNLGLAASLGLLSWRMMALHQIEVDTPEFEFNDLFALVSDRESLIGLLSGTTCVAGLLVNGSRGGLVAAMFGMILALGYVRPRRGLISLPVLAVVMTISVAILITPMNLNLETLERWEVFSRDVDTMWNDGRILHWQDSWRAAMAYMPGGAGLSSYAYAYLPYQEVSPGSWFEHADNLWLEMLVETGLMGLAVGAWLLAFLLIALNRLSGSVDPLDQGLRVAGWYAITAIIVSQFFDYGLVLPANLIAALLLGTAIISRDVANGGGGVMSSLLPTRSKMWDRLVTTSLAFGMIAMSAVALPRLREDAITDSLLSRLNQEYAKWSRNPDALAKIEDALQERREIHASPLLLMRMSTVQRDRAHLAEIREWRPQSPAATRELYGQTDLRSRQLTYPPTPSGMQSESLPSWRHYTDAWSTSLDILQVCPLAQEPRGSLLRLHRIIGSRVDDSSKFPQQPDAVAHAAAAQLLVFYNGNPIRQFALGEACLGRGDLQGAVQGFRSALESDATLTPVVMKLLQDTPAIDIADVIPIRSDVMQLAAAEYLQWKAPDEQFLRLATQAIACDEGASMVSRGQCQALLGRIHFLLNNVAEGHDHYQQAIRLAPTQANHRAEYIERLMERKLTKEALNQARLGRQSIPNDPRFQNFVDQIAASDRMQVELNDEAPAIDRSQLDALLEATPR